MSSISLETFDELSRNTPQIAGIMPATEYDMISFHKAGGVQAVLKEIEHLLHLDQITVNGRSLYENLNQAFSPDRRIIHTVETAINSQGGLAVLRGNLAPQGG